MIHAVYRASDGALVSSTAAAGQVAATEVLAAKGLTVKAIDMAPQECGAWDGGRLTFLPRPPEEEDMTEGDLLASANEGDLFRYAGGKLVPYTEKRP